MYDIYTNIKYICVYLQNTIINKEVKITDNYFKNFKQFFFNKCYNYYIIN